MKVFGWHTFLSTVSLANCQDNRTTKFLKSVYTWNIYFFGEHKKVFKWHTFLYHLSASLQAIYNSKCGKVEQALREAYQKSTGATSTPSGPATLKHGIVVDKMTGKFMATYQLGSGQSGQGSICKIFLTKADAEFWFDTMHSLYLKGRLSGNLSILRKAEATRKATAAVVEKIMKENITLEGETEAKFSRTENQGKDLFDEIFSKKKEPSLQPSKVRLYKPSVEQISLITAGEHVVEGYILGMNHQSLGWRALTYILTGDQFTEEQVDAFMKESGLVKIGVISSGTSHEPPEHAVSKIQDLATSCDEKLTPLLLHFEKKKFKVQHRSFEANPKTKKLDEVYMDCLTRRAVGETYQVLGTGCHSTGTVASGARDAATRLQECILR